MSDNSLRSVNDSDTPEKQKSAAMLHAAAHIRAARRRMRSGRLLPKLTPGESKKGGNSTPQATIGKSRLTSIGPDDLPCIHRGDYGGQLTPCSHCPGNKSKFKVFPCQVHTLCSIGQGTDRTIHNCIGCKERTEPMQDNPLTPEPNHPLPISLPGMNQGVRVAKTNPRVKWAYGVTTVPERRKDLLPRTLESLINAGFPNPRLFVDGDDDTLSWSREFNLSVTCLSPRIRLVGNWVLGLYQLYIYHHDVDMYAMFQDDMVICHNVMQYLSWCKLPSNGYLNLYSFPINEVLAPQGDSIGWYPAKPHSGKGGLALVFTKEQVRKLLTHRYVIDKHQDVHRGWRAMDGMVVEAMLDMGYTEYCHKPGLVQHTGHTSTFNKHNNAQGIDDGKPKYMWRGELLSNTFPGEDYDAMELLSCPAIPLPMS